MSGLHQRTLRQLFDETPQNWIRESVDLPVHITVEVTGGSLVRTLCDKCGERGKHSHIVRVTIGLVHQDMVVLPLFVVCDECSEQVLNLPSMD